MIEHELKKVERKISWATFLLIFLLAAIFTVVFMGIPSTKDPEITSVGNPAP